MQVHFFQIPAFDSESASLALNQLLSSQRIAEIHKEFVEAGSQSYWAICVTSVSQKSDSSGINKSRIDYRDVLPEADFAVFARLRTLRKEIADSDGVPPYAVFTNEQLAEMSKQRIASLTGLRAISGIGATRVEKYGHRFIEQIASAPRATDGAAHDGDKVFPN